MAAMRRKTIFCNAEEIDKQIQPESIDSIFLSHALNIYTIFQQHYNPASNAAKTAPWSFFAPIYSSIDEGDHGVIPSHPQFHKKPIGLHLLSSKDQRKKLISAGISAPQEIQDFLGRVNFDRVPNRLLYEDYERICTESPYYVLELSRQESYNTSKAFPQEIKEVRESNKDINNMMANGFRIHLIKV